MDRSSTSSSRRPGRWMVHRPGRFAPQLEGDNDESDRMNQLTKFRRPRAAMGRFVSAPTTPFRLGPKLARETDLRSIKGRVLCLMDDDNLRIGLRKLNLALSYRSLRARVAKSANVETWVVLSDADGAVARGRYL